MLSVQEEDRHNYGHELVCFTPFTEARLKAEKPA
jgi:hypothetical protein